MIVSVRHIVGPKAQGVTYPFCYGLPLVLRDLLEQLPIEGQARYELPDEDTTECVLQLDEIHYSHRQLEYSLRSAQYSTHDTVLPTQSDRSSQQP